MDRDRYGNDSEAGDGLNENFAQSRKARKGNLKSNLFAVFASLRLLREILKLLIIQ